MPAHFARDIAAGGSRMPAMARSQTARRKQGEIALTAAVILFPFMQAIQWLAERHPEASQARHEAVWLQAIVTAAVLTWLAMGFWRATKNPG